MSRSLQAQIAIVTGAGSGIGRACSLELAREGAVVILAEIHEPAAQQTHEMVRRFGGRSRVVVTDVTDPQSVRACVRAVLQEFGRIDILVNNAGAYPRIDWPEVTEERWHQMLEVNLSSAYRMCHAVTPTMMSQRRGKIINISSITVEIVPPGLTPYITSKAGLIGLTRSLARELGDYGINVNCIAPGAVRTEGEAKTSTPEQIDAFVATQCLKRRVEPWDIARAAVFLVSEDSRNITGQTLVVDAGKAFH